MKFLLAKRALLAESFYSLWNHPPKNAIGPAGYQNMRDYVAQIKEQCRAESQEPPLISWWALDAPSCLRFRSIYLLTSSLSFVTLQCRVTALDEVPAGFEASVKWNYVTH